MQNPLTMFSGKLNSAVMGAFGASEEHKKYLASGYCCPKCGAPNTNMLGTLQTHFYDSDGKRIMLMTGGALRGDTAECPKCLYRWKMYGNTPAVPQPASADATVVETDRSEEVLGEDRRVIDNARSSSKLTRTMTFSKEWTRSYEIQTEKAEGAGAELSLGVAEAASLKASYEDKLRNTYTLTQETKETCSEQVECSVEPHTKLTVVVRWKRIWQNGYLRLTHESAELRIPFRVAVGITFDQEQVDST